MTFSEINIKTILEHANEKDPIKHVTTYPDLTSMTNYFNLTPKFNFSSETDLLCLCGCWPYCVHLFQFANDSNLKQF